MTTVKLPPAVRVAIITHDVWWQRKLMDGKTSWLSSVTNKELMVPWDQMDPLDQQEDIYGVRTQYNAVDSLTARDVELIEERTP